MLLECLCYYFIVLHNQKHALLRIKYASTTLEVCLKWLESVLVTRPRIAIQFIK